MAQGSTHAPSEALDANSSTGFLLALLGQDAMRRLRGALTSHGLKPRQFQILELLAARGPTGQRELGELMSIDHSILVTMLNPLEDEELIERRRSCTDRRRHVVTITTGGQRRLTLATRAHQDAEVQLFSVLNASQQAQLHALLATMQEGSRTEPDPGDCE